MHFECKLTLNKPLLCARYCGTKMLQAIPPLILKTIWAQLSPQLIDRNQMESNGSLHRLAQGDTARKGQKIRSYALHDFALH